MAWSWRVERAYWAGEWPLLWRRGWWLLPLLLILTFFSAAPFVAQLINWTVVVAVAIIVLRRIRASRHFDSLLQRRWQEQTARWIVGAWPSLAVQLGLEVKDFSGRKIVAGAGNPSWEGSTCILQVSMPPGLAREDLVAATTRIAQAADISSQSSRPMRLPD